MSPPLLHVGYAKAASTWLQRFLFDNGAAGFGAVDRRIILERLIHPHPFDFDARKALEELRPHLGEASARGAVPVVSAETLCGNAHSGGRDAKELAGRLHTLFPDSPVLIVIREQRAMIASTYKQFVRVGGACPPAWYLQPPPDRRVPGFDFDHFAYHRLIAHYRELFGGELVLVLPFEEFRIAPDEFARKVIEAAGGALRDELPFSTRVKGALSPYAVAVRSRLNLVDRPTSVNPRPVSIPPLGVGLRAALRLDRLVPDAVQMRLDRRLRGTVERLVGDRYCESNRITAELTGLDLASYGYAM
ncbi:MAG: hypothetical protein ACRD29_20225 [Acidimicrobiales bacterium]